jgi:hypothetical protein
MTAYLREEDAARIASVVRGCVFRLLDEEGLKLGLMPIEDEAKMFEVARVAVQAATDGEVEIVLKPHPWP